MAVAEKTPLAKTIENASSIPLTPNLHNSGLQKNILLCPATSPPLPLGYLSQLSPPPSHLGIARYSGAHPQSTNTIPSDTTEWDPTMVSPARRDPSYNPTAANTAPPLNTGWDSSPEPYKKKQKFSTAVKTNSGLPDKEEIPVFGVFPALDRNVQLTQLRPIPLKLIRPRTFTGRVTTNTNSTTETTSRRNQEPLGTDIPPELPATSLLRLKKGTGIGLSVEQVNISPPILPAGGYQQQTLDTATPQSTRKRVMTTDKESTKKTLTTLNRKGIALQHLKQADKFSLAIARSNSKCNFQNNHGGQVAQHTQASVGSSWTPTQLPKQDGSRTGEHQGQVSQRIHPPATQYEKPPSNKAHIPPPKCLGCVPDVLPIRSISKSLALEISDSALRDAPIRTINQFRTASKKTLILDTTNPNFGIFRPGTEITETYDDPSWAFNFQDEVLNLHNMELEIPLITSYDKASRAEGSASGATSTSYSQRLGSPNSLICMYRVHNEIRSKVERRGVSLLHTKKVYIGESILLDMDMPEGGGLMEMNEVESLLDEMIKGEPGQATKLESVEKNREVGGKCTKVLKYVQWGS